MASAPPETETERLPDKLRRLREQAGLSQEDVAGQATHQLGHKITAGAVGQFERGVARPLPETVAVLARVLKIDPAEFVEYRLARARQLLDERPPAEGGVGLDQAAAALAVFDSALRRASRRAPMERFAEAFETLPPAPHPAPAAPARSKAGRPSDSATGRART